MNKSQVESIYNLVTEDNMFAKGRRLND